MFLVWPSLWNPKLSKKSQETRWAMASSNCTSLQASLLEPGVLGSLIPSQTNITKNGSSHANPQTIHDTGTHNTSVKFTNLGDVGSSLSSVGSVGSQAALIPRKGRKNRQVKPQNMSLAIPVPLIHTGISVSKQMLESSHKVNCIPQTMSAEGKMLALIDVNDSHCKDINSSHDCEDINNSNLKETHSSYSPDKTSLHGAEELHHTVTVFETEPRKPQPLLMFEEQDSLFCSSNKYSVFASLDGKRYGRLDPITSVPLDFLCPITGKPMKHPMLTQDGHTYEKKAILSWFTHKQTSPKTGLKLTDLSLRPNTTLKCHIRQWRRQQKMQQLRMEQEANSQMSAAVSKVDC